MKFTQNLIALAACFLPLIAGAPTTQLHSKVQNPHAQNVVPNSYIVVFKKDIDSATIESEYASVNQILSRRDSAHKGIGSKYDLEHFKGYQIEADVATIGHIASSPQVKLQTHEPPILRRLLTQTRWRILRRMAR